MSFKILTIPHFNKALKRLVSKYPSLKQEVARLANELERNPKTGTPLGKDCYKIRLAIASKRQGKSGGARIITCVQIVDEEVYLLTIYDKSEKADLTPKELDEFLRSI